MSSAAGLAVVRSDRKVLLVLRSAREATWPGVWSFPGGREEGGEGQLAAALRECLEELGSLPPGIRVLGAVPSRRPDGGLYVAFPAWAPSWEWAPSLNGENEAWGWFRPDALPRPMHPGAERTVAMIFGRRTP